jgi:acyl carrier protein
MFEEIKDIIVGWTAKNEEFEEITPETNILDIGGCCQICDIIDDIYSIYNVVFTVADIVKLLEEKLENSEIEVNDVAVK